MLLGDTRLIFLLLLHKKWSFPLRISSVNVSKSTVSCRFGHIYWRNPQWKTSFFCAVSCFRRHDCLRHFIVTLCEREMFQEICSYPYIGLDEEVSFMLFIKLSLYLMLLWKICIKLLLWAFFFLRSRTWSVFT